MTIIIHNTYINALLTDVSYVDGFSDGGTGKDLYKNQQTNCFAENGLNLTTNTFWFNQIGHRFELFNEEGA